MTDVYILYAQNDLSNDMFSKLMHLVSDDKKERLERFSRRRDAQNSLLADVLSRFLICQREHINNDQLRFETNAYGKPFVSIPFIHFNASHAGHRIAVAISDFPIGIDIETITTPCAEIAKRYFSQDESAYVLHPCQAMDLRFFEIWTKKEAYIKYKGKGLAIALRSFSVLQPPPYEKIFFHRIPLQIPGALCHICTEDRCFHATHLDAVSFLDILVQNQYMAM